MDGGNLLAGGSACARRVDRRADGHSKIAADLGCCRHRGRKCDRRPYATDFLGEEEERLVLVDWSTERAAKVVVTQHEPAGAGSGRGIVAVRAGVLLIRIRRIHCIVAKEFVQAPVKMRGARARYHVDLP